MKAIYLLRYKLFFIGLFIMHCSLGQAQNVVTQACPGNNPILTTGNDSGMVYQWQVNTGSGFTDLTDGPNYSGSDIPSIQLINLPSSWYGYQYRCLVDGVPGNTFILKFVTQWLNVTDNWSNPANWSCGKVPDSSTDVVIHAGGFVIVDANAICRSLSLDPNASVRLDPGVNLTIMH